MSNVNSWQINHKFNRFLVQESEGFFLGHDGEPTEFITQAEIFPTGQLAIEAAEAINQSTCSEVWIAVAIEVSFKEL